MTAPQRMRAWGVGVAAGHVALGLVATFVVHVPGSALFFGLCALLSIAVSQVTAPLLRPRGDDGGGGGDEPEKPPPWWPEFERDFQAYAQRLTSPRR